MTDTPSPYTAEEEKLLGTLMRATALYELLAATMDLAGMTHGEDISVAMRLLAHDNDCGWKKTPLVPLGDSLRAIGYPEIATAWEKFKANNPKADDGADKVKAVTSNDVFWAVGPERVQ